ncbi:LPD25 domain-containing protein [Bacillus sp. 18-5]|uniref:LPD25 domain-containing protein n=1 Tax=Bacillus sp. 18-5 TaxID=3458701 RepID=UPI0040456B5C
MKIFSDQFNQLIIDYFSSSESFKKYLDFKAKMFRFTPFNTELIKSQLRDATNVGSINHWKKMGFDIKKERMKEGATIIVPQLEDDQYEYKKDSWRALSNATEKELRLIKDGLLKTKKGRLSFIPGVVYDIEQTNASTKEIKKFREASSPSLKKNIDITLKKSVEKIAELNGIEGPFDESKQYDLINKIASKAIENSKEYKLYNNEEKTFISDVVSYSTCQALGLEMGKEGFQQLDQFRKNKNPEDVKNVLSHIHETSLKLINSINSYQKQLNNSKTRDNGDVRMKKTVEENKKEAKKNKDFVFIEYRDDKLVVEEATLSAVKKDLDYNKSKSLSPKLIKDYNEKFSGKKLLLSTKELKVPHLLIASSENDSLKPLEFLPFEQGNEVISELIEQRKGSAGYDRTKYHLVYQKNGELNIEHGNTIDIGDGLYDSIYEQLKEEKKLPKEIEKALVNSNTQGKESEHFKQNFKKEIEAEILSSEDIEISDPKVLKRQNGGYFIGTEKTYSNGKTEIQERITGYFSRKEDAENLLESLNNQDKENHAAIEKEDPVIEQEEKKSGLFKGMMKNLIARDSESSRSNINKNQAEFKKVYKEEVKTVIYSESRDQHVNDEERDKRRAEIRKFEQKHPYEEVYKLKKAVINELKQEDMPEFAKERLKLLEAALDKEKNEYVKEQSKGKDKNLKPAANEVER